MRVVVYTMVIEGRTDNLDLKDLPIYYQGFRLGIKDLNSPLLLVFFTRISVTRDPDWIHVYNFS